MLKIMIAIAILAVTPAHARRMCGWYYIGQHQDFISYAKDTSPDLINKIGLHSRYDNIDPGSCVCVYGVVKGGYFRKIKKIEIMQKLYCEEKNL